MPHPHPPRPRARPARGLILGLVVVISGGWVAVRGADHDPTGPFVTPTPPAAPGPPGGAWAWPGLQINPGSEEPAALLGPYLFPPRPELREGYWVVETRACPRVMGSDPWPSLRASQFDGDGRLVPRDPSELLARAAGRPVVVMVHGNLVEPTLAVNAGVWAQDYLSRYGTLPPGAIYCGP